MRAVTCRCTLRGGSMSKRSILAFAFLVLAANLLQAQNLGSISGLVTDKTGSVVPGATVKLTNQDTGLVRTFTTSDSGNYTAPALPAGTHTPDAPPPGFPTHPHTRLTLNLPDTLPQQP